MNHANMSGLNKQKGEAQLGKRETGSAAIAQAGSALGVTHAVAAQPRSRPPATQHLAATGSRDRENQSGGSEGPDLPGCPYGSRRLVLVVADGVLW